MERFAEEAPPLALAAARTALGQSGVAAGEITHVITACCTGFARARFRSAAHQRAEALARRGSNARRLHGLPRGAQCPAHGGGVRGRGAVGPNLDLRHRTLQSALSLRPRIRQAGGQCDLRRRRRGDGLRGERSQANERRWRRSRRSFDRRPLATRRQRLASVSRLGRRDGLADRRSWFRDEPFAARAGVDRRASPPLARIVARRLRPRSGRRSHLGRSSRRPENRRASRRGLGINRRSDRRLAASPQKVRQHVVGHDCIHPRAAYRSSRRALLWRSPSGRAWL